MRDMHHHISVIEGCDFRSDNRSIKTNQNWQDLKSIILDNDELLADLLEYFDGKQDSETFPDGHTIANEEMKFHMRISAILEGK